MLLCYVDESGDEQPLRTETDPPVLVLAGVVVDHRTARSLTYEFLQLKKAFHPSIAGPSVRLDELIRFEIKGSDLRKNLRDGSRNRRRAVLRFLDQFLDLLDSSNVKIVGQINIKGEKPLSKWVYPGAVAAIARQFEAQLAACHTRTPGTMILDARTKNKNAPSVHRITTERFRSGGDPYSHLVESPVFGHSDAHVPLQVADLLASALLFPIACAAYANCLLHNVHLNDGYAELRETYGGRLRKLEHRALDSRGRTSGGIEVIDYLNRQPTLALYDDAGYNLGELD